MAKAFTLYWTAKGWAGIGEGNPLRAAAGSGFASKIEPGDDVYITNVLSGKLRLLGSFTVREVVVARKRGKPAGVTWDAPEYLLAQEGTSSLLEFRKVPSDMVREIRFSSKSRPLVALNPDGTVNGQTMRAIRELSPNSSALLRSLIQANADSGVRGSRDRLPVEVLNRATPQHIWWAVQNLLAGHVQHAFGESTDYDLITDEGLRLPPKAVFGVALTQVLGWEVLPKHFTAGVGSPCFRLLAFAGYDIVPKGEVPPPRDEPPADGSEIEEWDEGGKKLVSHLKSERHRGLAKAKKAEFVEKNGGKLFCERCMKDPVDEYSTEHAEACIEVHHAETAVAVMGVSHKTKLEDLQCLCANCHRLVHRLLRVGLLSSEER